MQAEIRKREVVGLSEEVAIPALGILDILTCERRPGESLFDTAERILIYESMKRTHHHQKRASELLRVSMRVMNWKCANYGLRPKDRKENEE